MGHGGVISRRNVAVSDFLKKRRERRTKLDGIPRNKAEKRNDGCYTKKQGKKRAMTACNGEKRRCLGVGGRQKRAGERQRRSAKYCSNGSDRKKRGRTEEDRRKNELRY